MSVPSSLRFRDCQTGSYPATCSALEMIRGLLEAGSSPTVNIGQLYRSPERSFLFLVVRMLLVAMPGATNSVLVS